MRRSRGRLLAPVAVVVLAVLPGALGVPLHENPRLEETGFEIPHGVSVDRSARTLDVTVQAGECVGGSAATARERFDHVDVRTEPDAYVVKLRSREDVGRGHVCFGVGTEFRTRITLPSRIGRRAVVSDIGPHDFKRIVVPPLGQRAARALVPRFIYSGDACSVVAEHFKRERKSDWCL